VTTQPEQERGLRAGESQLLAQQRAWKKIPHMILASSIGSREFEILLSKYQPQSPRFRITA